MDGHVKILFIRICLAEDRNEKQNRNNLAISFLSYNLVLFCDRFLSVAMDSA